MRKERHSLRLGDAPSIENGNGGGIPFPRATITGSKESKKAGFFQYLERRRLEQGEGRGAGEARVGRRRRRARKEEEARRRLRQGKPWEEARQQEDAIATAEMAMSSSSSSSFFLLPSSSSLCLVRLKVEVLVIAGTTLRQIPAQSDYSPDSTSSVWNN
jgi:hypothetical protein